MCLNGVQITRHNETFSVVFQEILGTDSIQAVDCIIDNIQSSKAVLGEISINGTLIKMDNLADSLQVCLDCDAKKVFITEIFPAGGDENLGKECTNAKKYKRKWRGRQQSEMAHKKIL